MTLEDIKKDMKTLNEDLDAIVMAKNFDEIQWKQEASSIVDSILEDEDVKKILLEGTPEERKQYLDAIKNGISSSVVKLKEHSKKMAEDGLVDKARAFKEITKKTEKVEDTVKHLKAIEENNDNYVFSDAERINDLQYKIYQIDLALEMEESFAKLQEELGITDKPKAIKKSIEISKEVFEKFEEYEKNSLIIARLANSGDRFMQLLEEMGKLSDEDKIDMTEENQKNNIKEMIELANLIDTVDYMDSEVPKNERVKLSKPYWEKDGKITDKEGNEMDPDDAVDAWIYTIKKTLEKSPIKAKKIKLEPEFLDSREKLIKNRFFKEFEKSAVHRILSQDGYKEALKGKNKEINNIVDLKKYLEFVNEELEYYEKLAGKEAEQLIQYREEAEQLLKYYEAKRTLPNVSLNGKEKQLTTDVTDINKKAETVEEICKLDKEDEFRKEFETKALALAGTKPTDRWFHKLARIFTFGIYKTPEQKYAINLQVKRLEIAENLINEAKAKKDEANIKVQEDKEAYKQKAREKIYNDRKQKIDKKKFDKKEVMEKREKSQPLTR